GFLIVWDVESKKEKRRIRVRGGAVYTVHFSPKGDMVATGGFDGKVRIWSARNWKLVALLEGHKSRITRLRFSPDGRKLVSGDDRGWVIIWDVR
ncbi:MAG TPA: hypothetical protein EYH49_04010, partial [Aquifex aeolicus]|nr:hypothetical protein [Aquifex aeolicus]